MALEPGTSLESCCKSWSGLQGGLWSRLHRHNCR